MVDVLTHRNIPYMFLRFHTNDLTISLFVQPDDLKSEMLFYNIKIIPIPVAVCMLVVKHCTLFFDK